MRCVVSGSTLTIDLQGIEKLVALKGNLHLDKSHIITAGWFEEFNDWKKLELRLPGTYAPGLMAAGSFWTEDGWDFLYVRHPRGVVNPTLQNVLVIETDLKKYRRIIVGCTHTEAQNVIAWVNRR